MCLYSCVYGYIYMHILWDEEEPLVLSLGMLSTFCNRFPHWPRDRECCLPFVTVSLIGLEITLGMLLTFCNSSSHWPRECQLASKPQKSPIKHTLSCPGTFTWVLEGQNHVLVPARVTNYVISTSLQR